MEMNKNKRFVGKMMKVNRLHRSVIENCSKEDQLHRTQHQILHFLMNCKEPPSQKEIAVAFEVTPAAIAMSLKKLEAKGLIERVVAMEDNRVNLISISEAGKAVMERNRALFESTDAAMLEGVSDAEIETVSAILDKFIENLIRIGAEDEIPAFCKAAGNGKDSK